MKKGMEQPRDIFVDDLLKQVYYDNDIDVLGESSSFESRYTLESSAINKAYRSIDIKDRVRIDFCTNALMQACGQNFGPKSALQVLAKLGIFLAALDGEL